MKDSYWFRHDSNARQDEKIVDLRTDLGYEGYGIYWALIEYLRDSSNYEAENKPKRIAYVLQAEERLIEQVINNYGLFVIDEKGTFYSKSLIERMKVMDLKREQNRQKAIRRWEIEAEKGKSSPIGTDLSHSNATALPLQCDKSIEEKNIKENITDKVFVEITQDRKWIEIMCMQNSTDPDILIGHLRKFYWHCLTSDEFKDNNKETKKHFKNWILKGNPIPKRKETSNFDGF
jgi:hypothetical protein